MFLNYGERYNCIQLWAKLVFFSGINNYIYYINISIIKELNLSNASVRICSSSIVPYTSYMSSVTPAKAKNFANIALALWQ